MVEVQAGLYSAAFGTNMGGEGSGVVYLHDGKLHGGDTTMFYVGTYGHPKADGSFDAMVRVSKHTDVPGYSSVFGVNEVRINLTGRIIGDGV